MKSFLTSGAATVLGLTLAAGLAHGQRHGGGGYASRPAMHAPSGHSYQPRMHTPTHSGSSFVSQPRHVSSHSVPSSTRTQPSHTSTRPSTRTPAHTTRATTARPSTRPTATSRPTHSVNNHGRHVSSAVASKRVPASTRPSTTGKRHPSTLAGKGHGSSAAFSLAGPDNKNLLQAQGKVSPLAKAGIQDALLGRPMTSAEAKALKNQLNNPALTPSQKGSIASALQADAQMKRDLAATNNAAALAGLAGAATNALGSLGNLGGAGGGGGSMGGGGDVGGGDVGGGDGSGGFAPAGGGLAEVAPVGAMEPVEDESGPVAEEGEGGVRILAVEEGSAAEVGGLRVGDVILSFAGVTTPSFDDLREAVGQAGGEAKVVFINGENGQTEYLTVALPEGRLGVTCE